MTKEHDLPAPGAGPLPPRKGETASLSVPSASLPAPPPRAVQALDLPSPIQSSQQDSGQAADTGPISSVPLVVPNPRGGGVNRLTIVSVVACGVLASAVVGLLFLREPDDPPLPPATTSLPATSAPPNSLTIDPLPESTTSLSAPVPASVGDLPGGLFCRDLRQIGLSFDVAVDYWVREGRTERMDIDHNGVPCETVYPFSEVRSAFPAATIAAEPHAATLPSGLLCRDLEDRGADVRQALSYYVSEGFPDRMDADGNGVPCETVYADAASVWASEY